MTARPPMSPADALTDEERDLAARLARLDAAAGPSASLDARILAAARASAPRPRRDRRWPSAVGAAAVLVAAVGLAWQLRPMFELPPPGIEHTESTGDSGTAGAQSETVVQIESLPRAPQPAAPDGDAPAAPVPAAAPRRAPSVAGGAPASRNAVARPAARRAHSPDFVDEAMPAADASAPAFAPPPPSTPPQAASQESQRTTVAPQLKTRATARDSTGAIAAVDTSADTRLSMRAWLARIRERREAGDLDGARDSLQRFVAAHPRVRVPADLRPLLRDGDPWPR